MSDSGSDDSRHDELKPANLPQEIIHQIIASLDRYEDRRLLRALSQVNRICRDAAQSVLFERVTSAQGSEFFSYQVRTLVQVSGSGCRPTTPNVTTPINSRVRPRSHSPLPPTNLARHIRHLTLEPYSFFPLSICKWHRSQNRWSEDVAIDGQTLKWLLAYRQNLDQLFRVIAQNLESMYLPIRTSHDKDIDEPARTGVLREVKGVLGRYNMPQLRSLVIHSVDYHEFKLFSVARAGENLLRRVCTQLADVEDSSPLPFDRDIFQNNLASLKQFKLRTAFEDKVVIACDGVTSVHCGTRNSCTLRHLDQSNPYPPPHYVPWDDDEEKKEDSALYGPLMPYFRCVGTLSPFLSITRLELFKRHFNTDDFALHKILSYFQHLRVLVMKDVWLQHTYDSWFLVFRAMRRLKQLRTLRLKWLAYCDTGRCCRHRTLMLCAVRVEEDANEMLAVWEDMRKRREELEDAEEDEEDMGEVPYVGELNLQDVKMFCRRHETKLFENAIGIGDEDVEFTGWALANSLH